jgi:hypothetical protein
MQRPSALSGGAKRARATSVSLTAAGITETFVPLSGHVALASLSPGGF